jgi:NitT/TauT family transport system substrate-binding protein
VYRLNRIVAVRNCVFVAGAFLAAVMVLGIWSCSPDSYSGKTESITFGAIPSGSAALIYIAQDQGFFTSNGLSVIVNDYPTGIATIDALLNGDVDIAWSAEFPLVRNAFAKEQISIIATVSRFTDEYLIGRRDRGIEDISDLKGKNIGVPRNTIAEFYLARFLELNGRNIEELSIVDIQPPQSVETITSGSIDGVVSWEPFTSQIRARLADNAVAWSIQSSQAGYGIIIGRNDWIDRYPDVINRFLKSLAQSENYLIENPEAAKAIVQKRMNYDNAFIDTFWSETQFELSLDQSLITAMEDEARWMISNNLTTDTNMPDFMQYIYLDGLEQVQPQAVNMIR